uniref:WDHD1/CFT4 second beta-propeller domain-containing protein n=1 Tax=Populus trichocarpa TaxID=3694 RepID=A0A2K1XI20_POPTR
MRFFALVFVRILYNRHILSFDGPAVTASDFKNHLAVVTYMLGFRVFDISNGTQTHRGRLPLTPGSHLTWFGFSEEGQLSSYDSKQILWGVLLVFTSQYGGSWLPIFSYWVVGLNTSMLFCIVCKRPDMFPR